MISIVYLSMSLYSFDGRIRQFYNLVGDQVIKLHKIRKAMSKIDPRSGRSPKIDPKSAINSYLYHQPGLNQAFEPTSYLHKSIAL